MEMEPLYRLRMFLVAVKHRTLTVGEMEKELRRIIADEKARSYDLGVRDAKRGVWGRTWTS